jgi:hypothetical protein
MRYVDLLRVEDYLYPNVYRGICSMNLKKIEKYAAMPAVKQIAELKKWIESELDDAMRSLQQMTGLHPDVDRDIENVMATPLEDLPTLINRYSEDSMAHELVKKRLADGISEEGCWDLIDSKWGVSLVNKNIQSQIDSGPGMTQGDDECLHTNYYHITNLMELATILGDEDLHKKIANWLPPLP